MIPRLHKRGQSFKGACGYILHDAKTTSRDRVLWTDKLNIVSHPDDAWFEMFCVARDQAALKSQAGQDARGRKNTRPVLHYTLSWAAGDNPSPEHMRATALSSLKALGLLDHQVLMAAHSDKEHLHVHIVVNSIHPDTGLTAPLKYTKERLSRWAEAYEREHGIHCDERIRNNAERARLKAERERSRFAEPKASGKQKDARAPYVPVKHRAKNRKQWLEGQDIVDRMKRHRAELDRRHLTERDVTWARHRQEFAALMQTTKQATDNARNHVSDHYRRRWRALYAAQRKELRHVANKATHIFERAVYVFINSERLGNGRPLSLRRKVQLILSPRKLDDAVGRMHRRERNALAQVQKADTHELVERAWRAHEPRFEALKVRHDAERTAERSRQAEVTRRSVGYLRAKNELILERQHGRPVRRAADAPPFETDAAYVARIRAEIEAFHERQRRPDTPTRQPFRPPMPVSLNPPDNDAAPPSPALPFNQTASPPVSDRAAEIRRDMEEWRKKNRGRDFGREI